VEIGSEKSKNKRKTGGSRARARWLTVAERRIKSAAWGGADFFFSFSVFLFLS
jgi:hypothetical protein